MLYVCMKCGMKYKTKTMAIRCEKWCAKHGSCNLDITKHAVKPTKEKNTKKGIFGLLNFKKKK